MRWPDGVKVFGILIIILYILVAIFGGITLVVYATDETFKSEAEWDGEIFWLEMHFPIPGSGKGYDTQDTSATIGRWNQTMCHMTYRMYISFDTSDLPDDASISSVVLSLKQKTYYTTVDFNVTFYGGTQPLYSHSQSPYLRETDWGCSTNLLAQWNISNWEQGTWVDIDIPTAQVNKQGRTQFELRSSLDDDGASNATSYEMVSFYTGDVAGDSQPKLEVTYTIPSSQATVQASLFTFFINNTDLNSVTATSWEENDVKRILKFTTTGNCYVDVGPYGEPLKVLVAGSQYDDWTYSSSLERVTISNVASEVQLHFSTPQQEPPSTTGGEEPEKPPLYVPPPEPVTIPKIEIPVWGYYVIFGALAVVAVGAVISHETSKPRTVRGVKSQPRKHVPRNLKPRKPRLPRRSKKTGRFK